MDKRIAIVVLFSLGVAGSASYFVYAMLVRNMKSGGQKSGLQAIVAVRDLSPGTVIHQSDLSQVEVSFAVVGNPASKEEIIGRGVTNDIYKGEAIQEARLSPKGAGGGLAGLIRPGMRAAAVRVNEVVGVSGFVRPGMHVDVITSGSPPNSGLKNIGTIARIVLQNLEVLSAGQDLDRDRDGKAVAVQVVNLLVAPEQAEILALASTEAKVQLILRNPLDKEIAKTSGTNTAVMFNASEMGPLLTPVALRIVPKLQKVSVSPVPAAVTRPVLVEIVNGSKRETVTVGYQSTQNLRGPQ